MNADDAGRRLMEVVRRRHLALATERTYCAWLRRYCNFLKGLPFHLPSEQKLERFLTILAQKNVATRTLNQAFNAIIFFYKEALGTELKNVQSLRARCPAHLRHFPTPKETWQLIKTIPSDALFATSLVVRLLYGCGLRVCEPLNLRIKDVNLEAAQLTIRAAQPGKIKGRSQVGHLADLVSLVRFALKQQPVLEPFAESVTARFNEWLMDKAEAGTQFSSDQLTWLNLIREHIATSLSIEPDDFAYASFSQRGGLGKAHQLFGEQLSKLLDELTYFRMSLFKNLFWLSGSFILKT